MNLIKSLAHTDKNKRDEALTQISIWLQKQSELSDLDLLKLWKGLYYCYWMSDKPVIQAHLADKLSLIMLVLDSKKATRYLAAYWTTIMREWHGIDRLRLDKFYLLARCFYQSTFKLLDQHSDELENYYEIMSNGPLSTNTDKTKTVPYGIQYHVIESFYQELCNSKVSMQLEFLEPFYRITSQTSHVITFEKLQESLWTPLVLQETEDSLVSIDMKKSILERLATCIQENPLNLDSKNVTLSKIKEILASIPANIPDTDTDKDTHKGNDKEIYLDIVKPKKRVSFGENQIKKFNKKVAISLPFSEGLPTPKRPRKSSIKK